MTQYNPNDFYPASGKEINSLGNVVTPADGINSDGSQNVLLVGRKVIELVVVDSTTGALRDTLIHDFVVDVSSFEKKSIIVNNQLGVSVTLQPLIYNASQTIGYGLASQTMASNGGYFYSGSTGGLGSLNDPVFILKIRLTCASAPTTGSIQVWLDGLQK